MPNIDKAIRFAAHAHRNQTRKGGNQPYIFHPLEVLSLVSTMTLDDDVLCAAVLHDTVEDTDTTIGDIRSEFNEHVARLVYFESEDKRTELPPEATWKLRKQDTINTIKEIDDIGGKMVCLCDKVSNLRSFNQLVLSKKDKAWDLFHEKDPKMHFWYYNSLREALVELKDYPVYKEFEFLIHAVFDRYLEGETNE